MAPTVSLGVFVLVLGSFHFSLAAEKSLPKDMHRDMYCIGCEMTMKVIDRALKAVAKDQLAMVVPKTLKKVCNPELLEISEYSKDTLSEACEHLTGEHRTMIEAALINHYSREIRSSYLDLVQKVCLDLTDACHGVLHDDHNHDPLIDDARVKLDPESNKFVVMPGKNLKVAKPVLPVHEDL